MIKWLKQWLRKNKKARQPTQVGYPSAPVLMMKIDESGRVETNLPQRFINSAQGQAFNQAFKVLGYVAMLEMQSPTRTLH